MIDYAVYEAETGRIVQTGLTIEAELNLVLTGWGDGYAIYAGVADRSTDYMVDGEPVVRPAQATAIDKTAIAADGVDQATISGAPADSDLTAVNLTTGDAVSGPINEIGQFATAIAGTILLTVSKWPYLDWSATVEAV
ncbi:hypothetical protein [Methylomonas sp. CM2]|uniref:hypothetical protein n=1 Tax=Methylomonas sp. CM2 TaxID=3417647 RepID=UPI003CE6A352